MKSEIRDYMSYIGRIGGSKTLALHGKKHFKEIRKKVKKPGRRPRTKSPHVGSS